jgi:hypothetical protein
MYATVAQSDPSLPSPYQCYYSAWLHPDPTQAATLFANSSDGISWDKPLLHLVNVNGSTANNVLMAHSGGEANAGVWYDKEERNISRRWKAFGLLGPSGVGITWSEDGVHGWGAEHVGVQGMMGTLPYP